MQIIVPTAAENAAGQLEGSSLASACAALTRDGLVLLRRIAAADELRKLERRMQADTASLLEFVNRNGGNPRARGHLQQGPPPTKDFVLPSVVMNPIVNQVSSAVMGCKPNLTFYNGNTNCPGSSTQGLHADTRHLFPDWKTATPPWQLVVNIPTDDCSLDNGAIELWPGTHQVVRQSKPLDAATEAARRQSNPPVRAVSKRGDILLRDGRLWHRGVPNRSHQPRQMIALIHSADWAASERLTFETGCEAVLNNPQLGVRANYTDEPTDYLYGPSRRLFEARGLSPE